MKKTANGKRKEIDGRQRIYYDGYWIRYYAPPRNTLAAKKYLIDSLTRRLFHHTEPGINTPGEKLDAARAAYEAETDPARKRVNGAMLAGALVNRAADIFTTVVELAEKGVRISLNNELLKQCGEYFEEALHLAKGVKHYSGQEGIDELWGEPFKAFAVPIKDFYESRYIKIAQTMRDIDLVAAHVSRACKGASAFKHLQPKLRRFSEAAKRQCETLRTDPEIFEVWPEFIAAGEELREFEPRLPAKSPRSVQRVARSGVALIRECQELITYLAEARVPMPKSTAEFLNKCDAYVNSRRR